MLEPNHPINRFPNACPCCGYATLDARGQYDICTVCWWEDDGQDNHNANIVRGGPNSHLSLTRARINFLATGIFQPSRTDLREQQQPVGSYVQQRRFTFDDCTATIAEPALGWSSTVRELDDNPSQSLYVVGDQVRVVLNYRNTTPRTGTIATAVWHHKLGVWQYQLVDGAGHEVSKRYEAPDLVATTRTSGGNTMQ
ncbi:MAG: CPCC family cysteine-rich protein [Pirellulaceae bacterium]|nr:CPCC family cysteine-rich protein [Pirellulaceae bacterium]